MNTDIYERHRQAVEEWRSACEAVRLSEELRDKKRQALDNIGQELLASCANSKPAKQAGKRGRRAKANGVNVRATFDDPGHVDGHFGKVAN